MFQVFWDVHGAACTPSWVCCREALRRDRDLFSHSRPHIWPSSATRYVPFFRQIIQTWATSTRRSLQLCFVFYTLGQMALRVWTHVMNLMFLCELLSPSLRWSISCVPAQTHQDPPCAICGPVRTSCSLTCSTYPTSCPVSVMNSNIAKHKNVCRWEKKTKTAMLISSLFFALVR